MRLYCEVDVPFDKRSSRNKSSHTLLQRKKKDFILDLGENPSIDPGTSRLFFITFDGEPGLRYRYLSTFLSHLVENPGMNLGTSRLFVFTSGGEPGHRSLYLSTFLCHIWWRTRYLSSFLSQICGHADEHTNNRLNYY
jgi:hypothetical protein